MAKPDGGPAFPQSVAEIEGGAAMSQDFEQAGGMTLRDYFAAQAMGGIVRCTNGLWNRDQAAAEAYAYADAMIAERAKGGL